MSHYRPYPEYRDSGIEWIGKVPGRWDVKPIWSFATCNDNALGEDTDPDYLFRYVDISSVNHTDGIAKAEELRFADAPSRARRKAQSGDIIVSTVRTYLKAVAAVDDAHADCVFSTGFAVLRAKNGYVRPRFLKWLMLNDLMIQAVESHSEGLSYPAINATELVKLKAAVPSVTEQESISTALYRETARIDALIAKKTEFIELLNTKRHALITHAVTKGRNPKAKMRDSGVEWIGEVPEHWAVSRLGHFATVENGTTPDKNNPAYWKDGTVPWLGSGEVNQRVVTQATSTITDLALRSCSLRLLPAGTVIIGMVGQGKTRALSAILGIEASINQNMAAICTGSRLRPLFLLYVLTAAYDWIREAGRGSNQAALNCEIVAEFRLAVPPLAEQEEIVARLETASRQIDRLRSKIQDSIDLLRLRRSALIAAAVTGQIDLREYA